MNPRMWLSTCLVFLGCAIATPSDSVLPSKRYAPKRVEQPPSEIVFIAGTTDTPRDIERHDVVDTLRHAGIRAPVTVVYHPLPAYIAGRFNDTLHRRLVEERRARGKCRFVWVGFSSGGLAAIEHARTYPEDVDGLILYAPYLGPTRIVEEIAAAGGLQAWTANEPIEDIELAWQWLAGYTRGEPRPPLVLMFGSEDLQRTSASVLMEADITREIYVGRGAHGWEAWDPLWKSVVAADPLHFDRPLQP